VRRRRRLLAARRYGEGELLWHGRSRPPGVDAVVIPGGFSYGDYLRVGAIARFSPVMEAVPGVSRPRAARCSGSAMASRCCARHTCCGALLPNTSLPVHRAAGGRRRRQRLGRRSRMRRTRAESLSIPVKHTTGRYYHRIPIRSATRSSSATPPARTPTALSATSPASRTVRQCRPGLMPHPEHAVDPLTGSPDGGKLFESMALAVR